MRYIHLGKHISKEGTVSIPYVTGGPYLKEIGG